MGGSGGDSQDWSRGRSCEGLRWVQGGSEGGPAEGLGEFEDESRGDSGGGSQEWVQSI